MRAYLTGMGPVLDDMRAELNLAAGVAGLLIAMPTLYFGVFGLLIPRILHVFPPRRLLVWAMLLVAFGVVLRSTLGAFGLFAGLLIASIGVSVLMVIVPAIIKGAFGQRVGLVMSFYTMTFSLGASLGAGLAVPLARLPHSSWQWSLAFWMLPALAGALAWSGISAHCLMGVKPSADPGASVRGLYCDRLAWQVTLYMGLQSCVGQSLVGWMPAILVDRGMLPMQAGAALSISLLTQLLTNFSAPWLATRVRDQRLIITIMMGMMLVGVLGVFYAPISQAWAWIFMVGLGMGGNFALAVSLLVLRTRSLQEAAALSSMAQGVGYTVASIGPLLVGILYEYSHDWHSVAMLFSALCIVGWAVGMGAGRSKFLFERQMTA
jgi:CP family cyanate transporter-like MFS transporter